VSADEIDDIGLAASLRLATARALQEIEPQPGEEILIDGSINFAPESGATTRIKADQTVSAVSAASICAKVARDKLMIELADKYPNYHFERHVGYGTAFHAEAIHTHGYCILHRRSFKLPQKRVATV
jgi:ribonuclease HII